MTEEQKKEAIRLLEEAWGKPSYSSGLDLFGKSHESVANNTKSTANNISSTSLEELLSEIDNNKKL
jgi:hypothetical protein